MLFHSSVFLYVFLPTVFCLFFLANKFTKIDSKLILIVSGLIFYSWWNVYLTPLIILSILFNFYLSKFLINENNSSKKKILLSLIAFNILFLIILKYLDFLILNINYIFNTNLDFVNLPFPLAISFITFQTIAYLVDCYDGNIKKNNIIEYSLFIIFFPQLIAGPIVHYNNMMPQFKRLKNKFINKHNIFLGITIIFIGFFKKVIIADNLSLIAEDGFIDNNNIDFFIAWLTSLSFTFQIYFDFSGYIDMATGSALLFNIKLPKNFDSPFKSTSMINFWQRWHITLSNFLMNYIYFPWLRFLKKITFTKSMIATFFVFIIAGIWHGPSWSYVIFGGLHGVGLIINHTFNKYFDYNLNKFFAWFLTFNYVNITLIFFRSKTIENAINIIKGMLGFNDFQIVLLIDINFFLITVFLMAIIISFCFKNTAYLVDNYFKKSF